MTASLGACTPSSRPPTVHTAAPVPIQEDTRYARRPHLRLTTPPPTRTLEDPWVPGPDVTTAQEELIRWLFDELGLPDPRGLELRYVSIWNAQHASNRNAHGGRLGPPSLPTVGFVLPEEHDGHRFVIAPDGLIYPAERIGELADATALDHTRASLSYDRDRELPYAAHRTVSEAQIYFWNELKLRAGLPLSPLPIREGEDEPQRPCEWEPDGFIIVHYGYAFARRAVRAHMRGDDVLALHDIRQASELYHRFLDSSPEPLEPPFDEIRRDLEQLVTLLLPDQERRARERENDEENPGVAGIRELEDVGLNEWMNSDPVFDEEDLAIPFTNDRATLLALLDTVEHDTRLTRTVYFRPWRTALVNVGEIARNIFIQLAAHGDAGVWWVGGSPLPQALSFWRRFAERYGDMPEPERSYAILAATDLSLMSLQAAMHIVTTAYRQWPPGRPNPFGTGVPSQFRQIENEDIPWDTLRTHHTPSVTTLLQSRSLRVNGSRCTYFATLATWDPESALAIEGDVAAMPTGSSDCWTARISLHPTDTQLVLNYVDWLRRGRHTSLPTKLRPAIALRADPRIFRALQRLFRDPQWREPIMEHVITRNAFSFTQVDDTLSSLPFVREELINRLQDTWCLGRGPCQERVCDQVAARLSRQANAPSFSREAPIEERDAAIREMISRLRGDASGEVDGASSSPAP